MREKCLDVLTRRVTLGLEGGVKSWTPGRNETEDGGGINGRSDEGPGAARSARRQSGQDNDGVGGRQPARAARARGVLHGHGEGRREALRRASAERHRGAARLPGCSWALAGILVRQREGSGARLSEGADGGGGQCREGVQASRRSRPGAQPFGRAVSGVGGAGRQGHSGNLHSRRHHDEGRLLPELGYFVWFFRFSSRSSRERRRSRSAETSSLRRSASGSAPSRFGSARVTAIPQPAREAQSWKMRSTSRWLKTMPSRLDFIDRWTKSCHASPCLMSWWRNAVGSAAR